MSAGEKGTRGRLVCRVLTPRKSVFDDQVDSVTVSTVSGVLEIYAGFEPTIAPLTVGVMEIHGLDGHDVEVAVHGGYMDMNGSVLVILADSAELGGEIDVERARMSLERARAKLDAVTSTDAASVQVDIDRAKLAILRAMTRLQVAGEAMPTGRQE
ncbi:MAG: ATP synthase F1 subunit epsilon [Planctomycetes bacterium]|nr:ATP synthase F1 subunit epsilon [Planctomycetota bacterium]